MLNRPIILAGAIACSAAASAQAPSVDFSVDSSLFTKYIWRGINLVDGPVWQPSLTASSGGWSLNAWGSMELEDTNDYGANTGRGRFTEIDTTLAYGAVHGDWSWCAGLIDYQFPSTGFVRTKEAFLTATYESEWSPALRAYKDFDAADGLYVQLAARHAWPTTDGGEFALSATAGYGDENYTSWYLAGSKAGITDASVGLTYSKSLTQDSTLTVYGTYTSIPDKLLIPGSGKRDNLTIGVGVTARF